MDLVVNLYSVKCLELSVEVVKNTLQMEQRTFSTILEFAPSVVEGINTTLFRLVVRVRNSGQLHLEFLEAMTNTRRLYLGY